jgi:hypothetical protein
LMPNISVKRVLIIWPSLPTGSLLRPALANLVRAH